MPALPAFNGDSAVDLASRVPFTTKTNVDTVNTQYIDSNKSDKFDNIESKQLEDATWDLHEAVTEVDSRDAATPDKWVPRHPRLVRLTGRHPFNCEPPLPDLMERGFITPTALRKQPLCMSDRDQTQLVAHPPDSCTCPAEYVRNHGAVPKLEWDTHKISVTGMVDKPMTFTMNDLVTKFENVTLLCTLVCAGNRRKEQNMVMKTKGFNWGASGTGTGDALLHAIVRAFQGMQHHDCAHS